MPPMIATATATATAAKHQRPQPVKCADVRSGQLSQIVVSVVGRRHEERPRESNNEIASGGRTSAWTKAKTTTTTTRRRRSTITTMRAPAQTSTAHAKETRANRGQLVGPGAASLISYCLLLAVAIAATHQRAAAFPSGAPEAACKDLKPGHGAEPAAGAAPFELTQDKLQVEPGDQIKVTLSSPSKTNFKGLIVQALNEKGEPAKGKFLAGKGLKTLDSCSAVTHADKEAKKTATLVWEASSELKSKEAFTFKATVVQKFDEFYMNIKSTLASAR